MASVVDLDSESDQPMVDAPEVMALDHTSDSDYHTDHSRQWQESRAELGGIGFEDGDDDLDGSIRLVDDFPEHWREVRVVVPTLVELGLSASQYLAFADGPPGASDMEPQVAEVLEEEVAKDSELMYRVRLGDGDVRWVSSVDLSDFKSGNDALRRFHTLAQQSDESDEVEVQDPDSSEPGSDESVSEQPQAPLNDRRRRLRQSKLLILRDRRKGQSQPRLTDTSNDDDSVEAPPKRRQTRSRGLADFQMLQDSDDDLVVSDLFPPKRATRSSRVSTRQSARRRRRSSLDETSEEQWARRSGRTQKKKRYAEYAEDEDLIRTDVVSIKPAKPRVVHSKEVFPILAKDDSFVRVHNRECDTCRTVGDSDERGHLIYCQGCSSTYHKDCIGHRSAREHLVTKVSRENFVLQCRRCIGRPQQKDQLQASLDRCSAADCRLIGKSCKPFRQAKIAKPKTTDGRAITPDTEVDPDLLYNPQNVLFRCGRCDRAWHYDHLPPRYGRDKDRNNTLQERIDEYTTGFRCQICAEHIDKISNIVAWRPLDTTSDEANLKETGPLVLEDYTEDDREYLVRFAGQSYFKVKWFPGAWVAGAFPDLRRGYIKKNFPAIKSETDAIEDEWLKIDVVFMVEYSSIVPLGRDIEVDLARIDEVKSAFVKFRGLTYDEKDVVWEEPPPKEDEERWKCWRDAYVNYVRGFHIRLPKNTTKKVERARDTPFEKLRLKHQPDFVKGGTMRDFQKEGMNWLYYKWWQGKNAILADEMGLGKTMQVISFLAVIFEKHSIFPFLVVVPHSTVPEWKRAIQLWAPSLRVVTYFGADVARRMTREHEMLHGNGDLKCHVVITSYDCPSTDIAVLGRISWECLVVDEGQRLKNDASLLYRVLEKYRVRHKVLMSGTPLQNNPRELFNLLHFLDPDVDAEQLEEEFGELNNENLPRLHNLIRPYFLRRTKTELKDLPPIAEVILPVTMSTLQRNLYKSILTKDPLLIAAIMSRSDKVRSKERAKLSNLLMQLRKCVCHPFLYDENIEERVEDHNIMHRNLVEAGSKLALLSVMLPKLQQRGHRVLLFSQFLGMLDIVQDFLDGMGLKHERLDGRVPTIEKQKRIDAFNAPGSPYFAFLLSTRAGGVGINLATADTVIILDPDFNPHQDIQACSRAHRIGQKNKVLVFHLVTRDTAEERIIQIGKKKLSMDHLIINKMTAADNEEQMDVESILRFGAEKLFDDDAEMREIRYDDESVDKLLDRSAIEETTGGDGAAENAFSFARVWENDKAALEENTFADDDTDNTPAPGFWEKVLREREEEARREKAVLEENLGRGRRKRTVQYFGQDADADFADGSDNASDTDFQAGNESQSDSDGEEHAPPAWDLVEDLLQVQPGQNPVHPQLAAGGFHPQFIPSNGAFAVFPTSNGQAVPQAGIPHPFRPAPVAPAVNSNLDGLKNPKPVFQVPVVRIHNGVGSLDRVHAPELVDDPKFPKCRACAISHMPGSCPLKLAGVETCPLCGIAHFGMVTSCPHMSSTTQLNAMLDALKRSPEDPKLVETAMAVVESRKAVIQKVRERAKAAQALEARAPPDAR